MVLDKLLWRLDSLLIIVPLPPIIAELLDSCHSLPSACISPHTHTMCLFLSSCHSSDPALIPPRWHPLPLCVQQPPRIQLPSGISYSLHRGAVASRRLVHPCPTHTSLHCATWRPFVTLSLQRSWTQTTYCPSQCTQNGMTGSIFIFSSSPHMHTLGRRVSGKAATVRIHSGTSKSAIHAVDDSVRLDPLSLHQCTT